jgi:multicomponent Na+:H+ antiporter subunit E
MQRRSTHGPAAPPRRTELREKGDHDDAPELAVMGRRLIALFCWAFAVWVLLTWTRTAEQLLVGAGAAIVVAVALAPLGDVVGPWQLLTPRRLAAAAAIAASSGYRIVAANLRLSRLIWDPALRRRLRTGMVIVPTTQESAGGLTAVGLITSLIVDNQLVDLDRSARQLQYHAVEVPEGGPEQVREKINGPLERRLQAFTKGSSQ